MLGMTIFNLNKGCVRSIICKDEKGRFWGSLTTFDLLDSYTTITV